MSKWIVKYCKYCGKDTTHKVGRSGKKKPMHPTLMFDFCTVCRKDYPNKR